MMKTTRALFSFILLLTAMAGGAKEYSFEQALERAMTVDENLLSAQKEAERFRYEKYAARGHYFPKLGVKGSYTYIDAPIEIDLNAIRSTITPLYPPGTNIPPFITRVQDDEFFKAQAYASFTLFTGGQIRAANLAAKSSYKEALAKLEGARNNILVDTVTKYYGALLAREVVTVREQFLKSSKEHADNAAKMYKAGTISKVEKMSADVVYSQAKRDYDSSLNDADMANTLLQNLLSEGEEISFSSSMFIGAADSAGDMAFFQNKAVENNTILKMLDANIDKTRANVKAQSAAFMPDIYLFASRELYENDLTLLDPEYSYGVGLNWNLFEGASARNKTKAALRQKESVEYMKQKHTKDINTAVEYYHKKMQNALYQYYAAQQEAAFTKEFYNARELAFKAGAATSLEVNMALTQRLKSELDSLQAQYNYATSLANILSISGMTNNFNDYKQQSAEGENESQFAK